MSWLSLLALGLVAMSSVIASPQRLTYLVQSSEEVDSAEHGGEAGPRGTTCPCGWANKVSQRIVNGTQTARNEFPFAAGLSYRRTRSRFCGATIITRYHALTAAHCTEGMRASQLSLLVGMHNINTDRVGGGSPADEIFIERIIDHPGYDSRAIVRDISLLVMEREIQFSQLVGPACLPPASPRLNIDRQYIKIIGWGAGVFKGAQSPTLNKVDVRVVPTIECARVYSNVDSTQVCTYARQKASCQGDSGGPVMWVDPETNRYTHVGIVSFGRICGDASPSVHTSVQAYLDWIQQGIRASNKPNSATCSRR